MNKSACKTLVAISLAALVAGCATWSDSSVQRKEGVAAARPSDPAKVAIMEGDASRRYHSLGDITVTVNKTTVFNQDPTREQVNEALKAKAAELGADAVIHVRYGTGGVSMLSWGSLEGKGRAIKYD